MDTQKPICRLPLMTSNAEKKEFYCLDMHGRLQHWQIVDGNWNMLVANLFQQSLEGFDGALDKEGLIHLLGYDHRGNIYHLVPFSKGDEPKIIHKAGHLKINYLACCFNPLNQLQILYLNHNVAEKQRQHLYHLNTVDPLRQASLVDFADAKASFCSIFSDRLNQLCLLYHMPDENSSRIAIRCMDNHSKRYGRIYLLPGRQGSTGPPSYYCDTQNNIHLTWISRYAGKTCLNYIRRNKKGDWRNFLQTEVPTQTLPAPSLFCTANELLIYFQWGNKLGTLCSRNGGTDWRRGKDQEVEHDDSVLIRLRIDCFKWKKHEQLRELFLNVPQAARNSRELNSVAILSMPFTEKFRRLEIENSQLRQKLQQKEKELANLMDREQSRIAKLEKMLEDKTLQSQEADCLYQKTLHKLLQKQEKEKEVLHEQLTLLRTDVLKLQHTKEQLRRENVELNRRVFVYAEKDKTKLNFEQDGKHHYLDRILRKVRTAGKR